MESSSGTPGRILAYIASVSIAVDSVSRHAPGAGAHTTDAELVPLLKRLQNGILKLQSEDARCLPSEIREAFVTLYRPLFFGATCGACTTARVTYLACLQTLVKMNPTAFHADWPRLLGGDLPSGARRASCTHSVSDTTPAGCGLYVHLRDEAPKLRHAVAASISTLIEGPAQRAYLGMAHLSDSMERVKSFISLSEVLGRLVVENVEALRAAVAQEEDEGVCAAMVRAMTTFLVGSWGEKGKHVGGRRMPGDVAWGCVGVLVQKVDDRGGGGAPHHQGLPGPGVRDRVSLESDAVESASASASASASPGKPSAAPSGATGTELVAVCLGSLASIFGTGGVPPDDRDDAPCNEPGRAAHNNNNVDVDRTLDVLVRCLTRERSMRIKLEAAAAMRGVLRWIGMQHPISGANTHPERWKQGNDADSVQQRQAHGEQGLMPLFVETKAALERADGAGASQRQKDNSNKDRLSQQLVLLFGDLGIVDWQLVNAAAEHPSARIRAAAFSCSFGAHARISDTERDAYLNLAETHATEQHEKESTVRSSAVKAYLEALTRQRRPADDDAARTILERDARVLHIISVSLKDSVLAVRINAATLAAEVASALWHSCMEHLADTWSGADTPQQRQHGVRFLRELLKSVIPACRDHEKVAVHSIRALGFLTGGVLRLEGSSTAAAAASPSPRSLSDLSDDIVSVLTDGMTRGMRGRKELQWSCREAIAVACMLRPDTGARDTDGGVLCARLATIAENKQEHSHVGDSESIHAGSGGSRGL